MPHKFNLIEVYHRFGTVKGELKDNKFKSSFKNNFKFFISFFALFGLSFKTLVGFMFDKNDQIQWFIGDWFNIFDYENRFWINICSISIGSTLSIQHVFFRWLNSSRINFLIYMMKIFHVIDSKNRYIGLTRKETELFWLDENVLNKKLDKLCIIFTIFSGLITTFPIIFFTKFKINLSNYILFGLIHSIHNSFYIFIIFNIFVNSNFFVISICKFFAKKFDSLNLKIEKLNIKKINNKKLKGLTWQFNYVTMELIKANEYFKYYFGSYFIVLSISLLTVGFLIFLNVNIMVKFVALEALFSSVSFIIIFPYYRSSEILLKINNFSARLNTISFESNVSLGNKIRINRILNNLANQKIGFSSFSLFILNNFNSFKICLSLISYILMILKVTKILN